MACQRLCIPFFVSNVLHYKVDFRRNSRALIWELHNGLRDFVWSPEENDQALGRIREMHDNMIAAQRASNQVLRDFDWPDHEDLLVQYVKKHSTEGLDTVFQDDHGSFHTIVTPEFFFRLLQFIVDTCLHHRIHYVVIGCIIEPLFSCSLSSSPSPSSLPPPPSPNILPLSNTEPQGTLPRLAGASVNNAHATLTATATPNPANSIVLFVRCASHPTSSDHASAFPQPTAGHMNELISVIRSRYPGGIPTGPIDVSSLYNDILANNTLQNQQHEFEPECRQATPEIESGNDEQSIENIDDDEMNPNSYHQHTLEAARAQFDLNADIEIDSFSDISDPPEDYEYMNFAVENHDEDDPPFIPASLIYFSKQI